MSDLHGITIAFDLDGTLLDPDGSAYRHMTGRLLAAGDLGLDQPAAEDAYESIRLWGRAMDRLGLANANHFRAHPEALAALFILCADRSRLPRDSRISIHMRDVIRESLSNLSETLPDRGEADWRRRLAAERTARALLKFDVSLGMFRDEVRRVAALALIADWAARYAEIERHAPLNDPRPLLDRLAARGAKIVVVSEGLAEVQRAKLARLGLGGFFADRSLVTQNAGEVPGLDDLDRTLEPFLCAADDDFDAPTREELTTLWRFRCIVHLWATKSPWFFGRCLHALRANPTAPASALRALAVVAPDPWRTAPLRFVMIGDRYDRDISPLHELLGPGSCLKVRLRAGRYTAEFPETRLPPDRRPSHTFTDWGSLASFLTEELSAKAVPPVASIPAIAESSMIDADLISAGHESPYEAVRTIARAASYIRAVKPFT